MNYSQLYDSGVCPWSSWLSVINQPLCILKYRDRHLERAGEPEGQEQTELSRHKPNHVLVTSK